MTTTADTIMRVQRPDGAIPWDDHGGLDPWNHVEAAMGLDAAGRHEAAARAYRWLAAYQNPDGSWCARYHHGQPVDHARDSSFTAYVAVGVLHHHLSTRDTTFLTELWPTVDRAITYTLTMQRRTGEFAWRQATDGNRSDLSLLTANSSIHHSLRCAITLSTLTGSERPQWTSAMDRLQHTIATEPHRFTPKPHAMDWYYPVLGGALDHQAARERLAAQWHQFVVREHGVHCVHHEPWVTAAETAELALTLTAHGVPNQAAELLDTLNHFRHGDGSYWTGRNYTTDTIWPRERTTWTSGAILLATAALTGHRATLTTFAPAGTTDVVAR